MVGRGVFECRHGIWGQWSRVERGHVTTPTSMSGNTISSFSYHFTSTFDDQVILGLVLVLIFMRS